MQYGHFDDQRREYVIETPCTPLPWINYLGSEDFLGMISNTMGGYCFYRDAKLQRLLRRPRRPGRPVLLYEGDRQESLEPRLPAHENAPGPVRVPPRHGLHGF